MNTSFVPVNLPFSFSPPLNTVDTPHTVLNSAEVDPNLVHWLDDCGVVIGFAEVFKKEPGVTFPHGLHLDGVEFDNHVKINFVTTTNSGGLMCWWKLKPGVVCEERVTVVGTRYLWANECDCIRIAESTLTVPSLINAGQLHSIVDIQSTRICYSFMLLHKHTGRRVLWSEVGELFGKYI